MVLGLRQFTDITGDGSSQPILNADVGEELVHVQPDVSIVLSNRSPETPGTLYITTKKVVWLSDVDRNKGYAVDFLSVSLHAVSRDPEAYSSPCIYTRIETESESLDSECVETFELSKVTEMRLGMTCSEEECKRMILIRMEMGVLIFTSFRWTRILMRMFIGDGAKLVCDAFQLAKEKSPCIIFIDEIDAIGTKRFDSEVSGHRKAQRTMLELLNQLDGFSSDDRIKMIAATNRADILDPALMRFGRLDRKIEFPHPTEETRAT